jgi:PAS domain S-box-containing protein
MATHAESSLLQRRFTQVASTVGVLVVAALGVLIWREFDAQVARELALREVAARERAVAVEAIVTAADVHLKALRRTMELALGTAPRLPPARTPGGGVADMFGEPPSSRKGRSGSVMVHAERPAAAADPELAAMDELFLVAAAAQSAEPFFRWSYYFSANRDLIGIYPWAPLESFMGAADQRKTFDGYFDYPVFTLTEPARNPRREAVWTPVYFDAAQSGLMVSHTAPVDAGAGQAGMVGTDILLSVISDRLALTPSSDIYAVTEPGGALVADSTGAVAKSLKSLRLDAVLPLDVQPLPRGRFVPDGDWYVLVTPVAGTPWLFASAARQSDVRGVALRQVAPFLAYLLLLAVVLAAAFALIRRRFIAPAFTLAATVEALALDPKAAQRGEVPPLWQPWLNRLRDAFHTSHEATERLRQAQLKSSAIIDVALDAVVTADEEGRVVDFNPAAERMFGHARANAAGRPIGDLIVPEHLRAAHEAGMARQKATGAVHVLGRRLELQAMRADGGLFPVEVQIHKLSIEGVRYAAYVRDLTSQKAAETELVESQGKLHQAEKLAAMGSLLAGVAHEINNPLAIVVAQAGLLEEVSGEPDTRSTAGKIGAAAARCSRIVKTFLSMARRQVPQRERVSLADVIERSAAVVSYGMRANGVELTLDLHESLPDVEGDADQLGQVLSNLLVNAQQAMDGIEGARRVTVAAKPDAGGLVELTVADNGPGIPGHVLPRIFEAFFTTKPAGLGTGIGLAICRNVVLAHGGTIEAGNASEGGAVFRIRLPALPKQEPALTDEEEPPAAGYGGVGLSILVVDDEADVAAALAGLLRRDGHKVETRSGVDDGLAALDGEGFDLVFCDVRMPGGGGAAFLAGVLKSRPALAGRVVFVTGDVVGAPEHLRQTFPGRDLPILEKPFARADVRRAVDEAAGFA